MASPLNSFSQMKKSGVIKYIDSGEMIEYQNLHIEVGFNPSGRTGTGVFDEEDDQYCAYLRSGGSYDQLEVWPRDEGGVWLVDGHRTHEQIGRLIEAGQFPPAKDGKYWIKIKQFIGNDIDRCVRTLTSARKKGLTDSQAMEQLCKLRGFGLNVAEMNRRTQLPESKIAALLELNDSNHDVQNAVKAGDLSRTLAVDIVKKHGNAAGAVIAAEVSKAKAAGRKKLMPSAMKPWSPPRRYSMPIIKHARSLLDSLPAEVLAKASNAANKDDPDEVVMVPISTKALFWLTQTVEAVSELEETAQQKARDKAAQTNQGTLEIADKVAA